MGDNFVGVVGDGVESFGERVDDGCGDWFGDGMGEMLRYILLWGLSLDGGDGDVVYVVRCVLGVFWMVEGSDGFDGGGVE